jgi:hypothetical protein
VIFVRTLTFFSLFLYFSLLDLKICALKVNFVLFFYFINFSLDFRYYIFKFLFILKDIKNIKIKK